MIFSSNVNINFKKWGEDDKKQEIKMGVFGDLRVVNLGSKMMATRTAFVFTKYGKFDIYIFFNVLKQCQLLRQLASLNGSGKR